ncbi:MAG: hypothetical protein ACYDHD_05800 [Vulcanimicrobiaceae bacterium]
MSDFTVDRRIFIASVASLLAAYGVGGSLPLLRSGAQTPENSGGKWSLNPTASRALSCPGVSILDIWLGNQQRLAVAHGQFAVATGRGAAASCSFTPKTRNSKPLPLFAITIPVHDVRYTVGSNGQPVGILSSDAGSFRLQGFRSAIRSGTPAESGAASFKPDERFFESLTALGFRPGDAQRLSLAFANVSIDDVRVLTSAFPDATLSTMIFFRLFGNPVRDAAQLKALLPSMTAKDLVSFAAMGITTGYVRQLKQHARKPLTPESVIWAREQEMVRGMVRGAHGR